MKTASDHFANAVQSTTHELYGRHAGTTFIYHSVYYYSRYLRSSRLDEI